MMFVGGHSVAAKVSIEIELEDTIAQKLEEMATYKSCEKSDIVNKALKKFISQHKDYFPGGEDSGDD